uniref:Serine hydrolase-like protein 2 n=1 Tax=Caligus rogercresseyi TaxID=217165 RepID=C1BRQ1_CALRO|nr:Serine hydrolase-like protein 2 [Caligus rogercresseyi]
MISGVFNTGFLRLSCRRTRFSLRCLSQLMGEEFRAPVPWGQISGRKWGNPEGHPWIGLHGWLDNAGSFDQLAPLFPKGHVLYCIDYPGHGYSSPIPEGMMYHCLDGPAYLQRVAQHLKLSKYGLLGHSFGAFCMIHAGMDPEPISHLVSLDLVCPLTAEPEEYTQSGMKAIKSLLTIENQKDDISGKLYSREELLKRIQSSLQQYNQVSEDMSYICEILMKRGVRKSNCGQGFVANRDPRHLVSFLLRLNSTLCTTILKRINVPHLVVQADKSIFIKEKQTQLLLRTINRRFKSVEVHGNHHVHIENPEIVINAICDFLGKFPA